MTAPYCRSEFSVGGPCTGYSELVAENAKLRELIQEMIEFLAEHDWHARASQALKE